MRYIDEFRDPQSVQRWLDRIQKRSTQPVRLMEFCGGHTHAIARFGLRRLLPSSVQLLAGPGCPVCVTSSRDLDTALSIAHLPEVILTTFGDMLRVPGSHGSLERARAGGADVRMVYSTLDALAIARSNPGRAVVFLGVGFETTAPTVAAAVLQAEAEGLANFSILSLHKLTPPAMRAILDTGEVRVSGIIGPGHVTTIIGPEAWRFLPRDYRMPCAIAGFEPLDILQAIWALVDMVEGEAPDVRNAYSRSVRPKGNRVAQQLMERVFRTADAEWRGLGTLARSGLILSDKYASFDAARRFPVKAEASREPAGCLCGQVLRGITTPPECPLFGKACRPEHPVGPCMVSGEGACAAYMQYVEA